MTLTDLKSEWQDHPQFHASVMDYFASQVNADDELRIHRDWVNDNEWGFGEKSFHWLWKLLVDEMPEQFEFLEIGVYRGAVLSLINILARRVNKVAWVNGVTPLDSSDGYKESNYADDIRRIHEVFDCDLDYNIIKGKSCDVVDEVKELAPFDMVYIDGDHSYAGCKFDLLTYAPMVKKGGWLLIDDAGRYFNLPEGMYSGHEEISNAMRDWDSEGFEFWFNLGHLVVYKRK